VLRLCFRFSGDVLSLLVIVLLQVFRFFLRRWAQEFFIVGVIRVPDLLRWEHYANWG
jgi:hypothetical protein